MTVTQQARRSASRILEGFCWQCEKPLDQEGWCKPCERRYIVRLADIEEWLPVPEEMWGKPLRYFTDQSNFVLADGNTPNSAYLLDGDPVAPSEPCWLVCEWAYR